METLTADYFLENVALGLKSSGRAARTYDELFAAFPDLGPILEGIAFGHGVLVDATAGNDARYRPDRAGGSVDVQGREGARDRRLRKGRVVSADTGHLEVGIAHPVRPLCDGQVREPERGVTVPWPRSVTTARCRRLLRCVAPTAWLPERV
jgi:hypothetical protein